MYVYKDSITITKIQNYKAIFCILTQCNLIEVYLRPFKISVSFHQTTCFNERFGLEVTALDFYLVGVHFESRPGRRLSSVKFFAVS
jgi:hypothetical protein